MSCLLPSQSTLASQSNPGRGDMRNVRPVTCPAAAEDAREVKVGLLEPGREAGATSTRCEDFAMRLVEIVASIARLHLVAHICHISTELPNGRARDF